MVGVSQTTDTDIDIQRTRLRRTRLGKEVSFWVMRVWNALHNSSCRTHRSLADDEKSVSALSFTNNVISLVIKVLQQQRQQ